jgi:hypothetical protein
MPAFHSGADNQRMELSEESVKGGEWWVGLFVDKDAQINKYDRELQLSSHHVADLRT